VDGVGEVYQQFERELAGWRQKYADRPRQEMIHLFLLALEREELVSISYRESLILSRLAKMPLSQEVRDLIHHALLWAWKDEEMHAVYIRGAILKLGSLRLRVQAFVRQLAGAVGGWSSSVRQHARWSEAPLSRGWATLITWAGAIAGKVPRDIRRHLEYGPFRNFCRFNVDAEKTAWLCWNRLIEVTRDLPDLPLELVADFRRIEADEDRHERVFAMLAAALDDQDQLVPGETADSLAAKIGAIGEFFLPRLRRATLTADNPLGSGGRVFVARGVADADKLPLFRRLLDDAGLPTLIEARSQVVDRSVGALRVAIKPTFMLGYHRKDLSPLTDPALIEELARYLHEHGCRDVAVVESRNLYDRFYQARTVREVAEYFGIRSPYFRVVDLTEAQVPHAYFRGMAQYTVGRTWKEADFRISFAKLRSHPVELAYLTLGNLEGLGARCDEFLFAERQAHRNTAVVTLIGEFPPHFALLDGYDHVPDGLLGMMGCPRPRTLRRLYAGADALAVDMVAARHLGVADPRESSILRAACQWFGDPRGQVEVVGPDEPVAGWRGPYHNDLSTILSFLAYPVYEFGSGRGALFVPEMDTKAFPHVGREGSFLRLGRRSLQTFLGLRHHQ
jgi:uncharacterized protein (DUF362 family)